MRKSLLAVVPALTALIVALVPSSALAVERPTTFALTMGSSCIGGQSSDAVSVHVLWKGAGGAVKLDTEVGADAAGDWLACTSPSRVLAIGDEIDATVDSSTHGLTVPSLTLQIDRVADRYFGRAPAGDVVTLRFDRDLWEHRRGRKDKTAKPDGTWSYQATHKVVGGLWASLLWSSPQADTVLIEALAPNITLNLDDSRFEGIAAPKSALTAKLLDPGTSALIAKKKVSVDRVGNFAGRFRDAGGDAVAVSVGDHFQAPKLASDADWIVPEIDGVAHADTDIIGLTCHDSGTSAGTFRIRVLEPDGSISREVVGDTEDNGTMALRIIDAIDDGDTVLIACMQVTGDWVQRAFDAQ
jgi:hypothetical protein